MWEDFEFDAEKVPNIKLALHLLQIIFGFVGWCLEIVVFRAEGALITGNIGWTFAVFFLSVPVWIYLSMAPRFPRTRHLAEPHVMVALDALYTVLWLSALSTQAAYNTANLCGTACGHSKAIVGLGFFVFLFFGVTTFLSIYSLKYYQFNGRLPGYDRIQAKNQNIDPDKAAFSMAPHGEEAYARIDGRDNDHDPLDPRDDHHGYNSGSHVGGPVEDGVYGAGSAYGRRPVEDGAYGAGAASNQASYSSAQGRHASPYGSDRMDDPYGGGRQQQQQENPFDQGRLDNNPFADQMGYTPPAGTSPSPGPLGGGATPPPPVANVGGMYVPPTAQDDYDDGRPVQFPSANYDRAR